MADQKENSKVPSAPAQQRGGVSRTGQQQGYFPSPTEFFANPFAAMRRMHEDMDRVFAQALGGTGGGMMSAGEGGGADGRPRRVVSRD